MVESEPNLISDENPKLGNIGGLISDQIQFQTSENWSKLKSSLFKMGQNQNCNNFVDLKLINIQILNTQSWSKSKSSLFEFCQNQIC